MANFLRLLIGIALLPACWGVVAALVDAIVAAGGADGATVEAISLLGGIAAFALAWMALSHPVKLEAQTPADVVAITGATVTTQAVTTALRDVYGMDHLIEELGVR